MATNEPVPAYRPTRVEDQTMYVPLEGAKRAKRIHYELADGHTSYIDVPYPEQYTPEKVAAALEKEAQAHFDVMAVQGPMLQPPS